MVLKCISIIFLGVLIYSNSFFNSFHFDDFPSIVNNVSIRNIDGLQKIWGFWPTRFITYFSFALNYHWGAYSVVGYHVFSLLLHILTTILVWQLILITLKLPLKGHDLGPKQLSWIAFFSALIFLTHPLQTQAVNYIVQRAVLLAAFFYLGALILYIKSRTEGKQIFYLGSIFCAVLSILSKENASSLPLMICFYEWSFFKVEKRFQWKKMVPFFLVVLIMPLSWSSNMSLGLKPLVSGFAMGMDAYQYFLTQAKVILIYIAMLFWPMHQTVEHTVTLSTSLFNFSTMASMVLLLVILGFAFLVRNNLRWMSFGIFWFFITLLPESSFWPIKDLIFEHRLYLPMVGFGIFISSGVFYFLKGNRISLRVRILLIFILVYSCLSYQRNKVWFNEMTLWDDAVHQSPGCARAYLNRGSAYQKQGDLDHALADYNMVIGLGPVDPVTLSNRGLIFEKKNQFNFAMANFDLAIKINPGYVAAYENRGKLYQNEGKYVNALKDFDQALRYQPQNAIFYGDRAELYFLMKDYDQCWQDVHHLEALGASIKPEYLLDLEKATGKTK